MAAIGDSITQAVNSQSLGVAPEASWSTGDRQDDTVESHYERVLARQPAIRGRFANASVPGARMEDGVAQARRAGDSRPDYVTLLFGGNDVCTSAPSTMTPVEEFARQYRATLDELTRVAPDARIFVASVPDVFRLWELFRDNGRARFVWRTFRLCQALLAEDNTDADRQTVRDRTSEFNRVLQEVCADFRRCRHDGGAVHARAFTADDVSGLDFFHPSVAGQAELAQVTWERSYWGDASPGTTRPTS